MWQGGDDDVAVFQFIGGPHAYHAAAGAVSLQDIHGGGDDFGAAGVVGPFDELSHFLQGRFGVIQQVHAGIHHLFQVVGRNVRGHAHGDAGGAVE